VTVLDNEAPENNDEDECGESEDMEDGTRLRLTPYAVVTHTNYTDAEAPTNQNRKRKRPASPSVDVQPTNEVDYPAADASPPSNSEQGQPAPLPGFAAYADRPARD